MTFRPHDEVFGVEHKRLAHKEILRAMAGPAGGGVQERRRCTLGISMCEAVSVTEARSQLAAIIDRARAEHQPVYLARRGRPVAAVIDADDLDRILELAQDMTDIRAAEQARAEMAATGAAPVPWEQVKAELGLT